MLRMTRKTNKPVLGKEKEKKIKLEFSLEAKMDGLRLLYFGHYESTKHFGERNVMLGKAESSRTR